MNFQYYLNSPGPIWGGIFWDRKLEERLGDELFLEGYGYKVYSQNDEDGIIHEIFNRIGSKTKRFIEFGVDRGIESNCHALLLQGWSGLWIEGNEEAYHQIMRRFAPAIREKKLNVLNEYVNINNIESIISNYLNGQGLDLLSIDVDGNDWHIWNAIMKVSPRVVVIEYNGKFPPEVNWKMAYNANHIWDGSDREGASLKSLEELGKKKGYRLVGTNICGINAFFVRNDLAEGKFPEPATAENLYNPARLNMIQFANGHPARNYVGDSLDGMEGVFEYYPDWNCIATFGFYPVEVYEDYRRFVMREKQGKLYIRFVPQDASKIYFYTSCPASDEELNNSEIKVRLRIDDSQEVVETIHDKENVIEVDVKNLHLKDRIVAVDIEVYRLWIPDEKYHKPDRRLQGLSFSKVEYL